MEKPALPPLAPGRPALPAFLAVERVVAEGLRAARARAETILREAEEEARRIRTEGEARLADLVLAAERDAVREAEGRQRDYVSDARVRVQRWIEAAEQAAGDAIGRAVDHCVADPAAAEGA